MVLISGINGSGLYAAYSVSAEKDDAGNVITATYMKDALFDFTDSDEISGYNGSAFATPAELSAGINTKIENNIIDVKNISCSAEGSGNIALGTSSIAGGKNSFIYGLGGSGSATNIASGNHCIVMGWHSSAIGNYSTVIGGNYCLASGDFGSEGKQYWGPFAQGVATSSINQYSHAEGHKTLASGDNSHSEGIYTYAIGSNSHAEGQRTSAVGISTHAEGDYTVASANCSHAEGNGSYTLGNRSHAEGSGTSAYGICSHSEGIHTEASGNYSHTEGQGTIAGSDYMHVAGTYNETTADALYVIGNGTADDARSDAFTITSAGNASAADFIAGNGVSLSSLNGININSYVKYTDLQYAIGSANTATGSYSSTYSVALGKKNSAYNSFVIGNNNKGNESYIFGENCTGTYSYLFGTELSGKSWTVDLGDIGEIFSPVIVGKNNATKTSAYFVVGAGTAFGNQKADAFIVSSNKVASAADFRTGNGVSLSSLTGLSQVQADWEETVTSNPAYIQNKPDVLIPVDSPAALGGISKPTNIMVVSALPASPDPTTIYLVQGTMIGN